jgi:hypothetical protein
MIDPAPRRDTGLLEELEHPLGDVLALQELMPKLSHVGAGYLHPERRQVVLEQRAQGVRLVVGQGDLHSTSCRRNVRTSGAVRWCAKPEVGRTWQTPCRPSCAACEHGSGDGSRRDVAQESPGERELHTDALVRRRVQPVR